MVTLTLQAAVALFTLLFGAAAVAVTRSLDRQASADAAAWRLTALAFVLLGVSDALHNVGAVWAYRVGPGDPVYTAFLRWSPMANHSRAVMMIGYALLLGALVTGRWRPGRGWGPRTASLLLLAALVGAALGWVEGSFRTERHYPMVALLDAATLLALLHALFRGADRALDRLLWLCLGVYALQTAVNVVWISARAWLSTPGAWYPSGRQRLAISLAAWTAMGIIALRRHRRARHGLRTGALLDLPEPAVAVGPLGEGRR